jgi:hypothetical protein
MGADRAQAVVARVAAADFHSDFCRLKVDFVMEYDDASGIELVEMHGF